MKIEGQGKALAVYIGETDHFGGKPLYVEIVERAHAAGLAGSTVTHGIMGFGANSQVHSAGILRLSEDLPIRIEIIDSQDKIKAFLPQLDELVQEGVVVTWDVTIEIYRHSKG